MYNVQHTLPLAIQDVDLILDDSDNTSTTPQPPAALRLSNSGAFEVRTNIFLVSVVVWQGVVADVHSDGRHQRGRQDDRSFGH